MSAEQKSRIAANTGDRLGESPVWDAAGSALYWVDFYGPTVHRLHTGTERLKSWTIPGAATIGALVLASGGRLILALDAGLKLFDPLHGTLSDFADPNDGRPGVAYNDAKVDRWGRCWVGTFDVAEAEARGILYGIDVDGRISVGDSGFIVCNGPAFSTDGRTLYFSDSVGRRLIAYTCEPGSMILRARRVFARFSEEDGIPDGLTVDHEGNVWCALYGAGRIACFSPDGRRLRHVSLPRSSVTSCCFGGDDLSTLFVTSGRNADENAGGGTVFALDVGARGIAEGVFDCGGSSNG